MILPTWFVDLGDSFSYKEVQFKIFCPSVKATYSSAKNINDTTVKLNQKLKLTYLGHS